MNNVFSFVKQNRAAIAAALVTVGSSAHAADGVDFTTLTSAISFGTVVTAILAVAALKVLPIVARWGAGKVLSAIGR